MKKIFLGIGEPRKKYKKFDKSFFINKAKNMNEYPKLEGKKSFKKSISKWIRKRNNIDGKYNRNIIPSLGNKEGIYVIAKSIHKNKRKIVVLPDPFYPCYQVCKEIFNKKIIYIRAKNRKVFMKDFKKLNGNYKNILMIFLCSPSNPTGFCLKKKDFLFIVKKSLKYNFKILSDECYSEIYFYNKPVSLIKVVDKLGENCKKNIYVINSLSKTSSLPGLRSGFIFSHKDNLKKINEIRKYNGSNLSNFNQDLSSKIWLDFKRTKKIRKGYKDIFLALKKIFKNKNIKYKIPEGGFYIWLNIKSSKIISSEFCDKIQKKYKITILPGNNFSSTTGYYMVRISLVESKKKCLYAVSKILDFLKYESKKNKKNNIKFLEK